MDTFSILSPALRPSPETFFEWFDRFGRPLLRVVGAIVVAGWGFAIIVAALRSGFTGASMPDMTAGLMPLAVGLGPNIIELLTRHREVMATRQALPSRMRVEVNPHGGPVNY